MKWEYVVIDEKGDTEHMKLALDFAGGSGWELVAVTQAPYPNTYRLWLKRGTKL